MVSDAATKLFKRCYEYRDEIREELESSVAYVADAGRWVVGMDDWNTKMERRLSQISEIVLLATSLIGEQQHHDDSHSGYQDELRAYLDIITSTIEPHEDQTVQASSTSSSLTQPLTGSNISSNTTLEENSSSSDSDSLNPFRKRKSKRKQAAERRIENIESEVSLVIENMLEHLTKK